MKTTMAALALAVPALVIGRAARVRMTVNPRLRYWHSRNSTGDFVLVALGDSLTQGIGSSTPGRSWLGRYVDHLELDGVRVRVDNRATYGARIADMIADQLPLPAHADAVTLCIGANDAGRTDPKQFRAKLQQVCRQLPPGSIVGDVPEFQWGPRIVAAAELSEIVREVVAEFPHLVLAEVEKATAGAKVLKHLAGDFFHPGDPAYEWIGTAFIDARHSRRRSEP